MADLISQGYLTGCLADYGVSAAMQALYPQLATAASRAIRKFCNRYFNRRAAIDELYAFDRGRPILLREHPVNAVTRVSGSPTTALSVRNTATTTNQRATVALATTGSADAGLVVTGLTLWRIASGVPATSTLAFADYVTIDALAAAIDALGGGWSATVADDFGLWPTADLRAVQGALPALGRAAELTIHAEDLPFDLEPETGTLWVDLPLEGGDPSSSPRWGDLGEPDGLALEARPMGLRVVYDAGWDTVPEDVQQACVEAVKAQLDRLGADTVLKSESGGEYSYTLRDAEEVAALPLAVRSALAPYRSVRL